MQAVIQTGNFPQTNYRRYLGLLYVLRSPDISSFFTPHIFRLGGLFRDFRNVRNLDHLLFVEVSPYGTLTTKWNDVEPSIHFLIRKGVLMT